VLESSWRIGCNATLHWKIWDDQCLVFNSASGQTHLLDPIAALLVRQVYDHCSNSEQLFQETARLLDVNLTSDVRATFEGILQQLDALGLIETSRS
jgi:PqqD family protein of HPr-rel-A system